MMAGFEGVLRACRSTQLYEALSRPSGNQAVSPFAKSPEHAVWKSLSQSSNSRASFDQNKSELRMDAEYRDW